VAYPLPGWTDELTPEFIETWLHDYYVTADHDEALLTQMDEFCEAVCGVQAYVYTAEMVADLDRLARLDELEDLSA